MAGPKRFLIPSLSQMENDDGDIIDKDKGSLFKRHKSSRATSEGAGSDTNRSTEGIKPAVVATTIVNSCSNTSSIKQSYSSNPILLPSDANGTTTISTSVEHEKAQLDNEIYSESSKSSAASKPGSSNSLIVNPRQRGNPILKSVRNIPWEYGNIVADYVMGPSNCALFLSLRYHQLHPNYIHDRLKNLGRSYELRVMLVQVDVKEPHHLLKDLAKICLLADCTLILAFSAEEAGKYLETYKVFENKPAEAIMERTEDNFMAKFVDCLTRVKSVNKTDCATLLTAFGSLSNIMEAKEDELCLCPGFGPQKAKRLKNMFQEPFLRSQSKVAEPSTTGT